MIRNFALLTLALSALLTPKGFTEDIVAPPPIPAAGPTVSEDGLTVSFDAKLPGLQRFVAQTIEPSDFKVDIIAPGQIAVCAASDKKEGTILLFALPELTSAYGELRRTEAEKVRAGTRLEHAKRMYTNLSATANDLADAERDLRTADATAQQSTSTLRAAGVPPDELEALAVNSCLLVADVSEAYLADVDTGDSVSVELASRPGVKLAGIAKSIGEAVDAVTRTVRLRVLLSKDSYNLKPGMFARVSLSEIKKGMLLIPLTSVVNVEQQDYVFIEKSPGSYERRKVVLQKTSSDQAPVVEGLKPNERVVVSGAMLLKGLSFGY